MGNVIFKPTCSKCGGILHKIDVKRENNNWNDKQLGLSMRHRLIHMFNPFCLSPYCCPYCGERFESVTCYVPDANGNLYYDDGWSSTND